MYSSASLYSHMRASSSPAGLGFVVVVTSEAYPGGLLTVEPRGEESYIRAQTHNAATA